MSVVLGTECPHCRANVAAEFVAEWVTPFDEINMWTVVFKCVRCQFGIFALAIPLAHATPARGSGDLAKTRAFRVMEIYPRIGPPDIPQYVPDNIQNFYGQALEAEVRGSWDACGAMCRKVVDVATVYLGADRAKKLAPRIDDLTSKHRLTPQIQEWAHAIRLDGNDATHDPDPFKAEEAMEIRSFTEIFLRYVFELPGMLNERRARKSSPPTP